MNPVIESLQDLLPKPEPRQPSREQIIASDPFAASDDFKGKQGRQLDFDVPLYGELETITKRKKQNE